MRLILSIHLNLCTAIWSNLRYLQCKMYLFFLPSHRGPELPIWRWRQKEKNKQVLGVHIKVRWLFNCGDLYSPSCFKSLICPPGRQEGAALRLMLERREAELREAMKLRHSLTTLLHALRVDMEQVRRLKHFTEG